jgi:hypothetical protein
VKTVPIAGRARRSGIAASLRHLRHCVMKLRRSSQNRTSPPVAAPSRPATDQFRTVVPPSNPLTTKALRHCVIVCHPCHRLRDDTIVSARVRSRAHPSEAVIAVIPLCDNNLRMTAE